MRRRALRAVTESAAVQQAYQWASGLADAANRLESSDSLEADAYRFLTGCGARTYQDVTRAMVEWAKDSAALRFDEASDDFADLVSLMQSHPGSPKSDPYRPSEDHYDHLVPG